MMKRYLLVGWACLLGIASLFANEDPVLLRIHGREVPRSEFEHEYRRYKEISGEKITPKKFAELFIDRKLKVAAAKAAGLDTASAFCKQQETYRTALLKTYLTDKQVADSCARALYHKKVDGRQVQVMQIFKYLPQTISSRHLEAEKARMDSVYLVARDQSDKEFADLVELLSDDKSCTWIESLQTTSEFEEIAFALGKGEVSKPFFTPRGLHILKVVDQKERPAYETVCGQLIERLEGGMRLGKATETVIERLKRECRFEPNPVGMEELLKKGETKQTLFTIDGKVYSGELFKRFASSHPQAVKRQLDRFTAKSLLDYGNQSLENKYPEIRSALQEYGENSLIVQLTRQKVDLPVANDRVGLATYFKFHESDYRWKSLRYRGVVLHCSDKKTVKLAKKMIKKLPENEWADTLRKSFNTPEFETIRVEQGVFASGENKYVDKLVFKKGDFEPITSYPFTIVMGRKVKGPSDYREVIGQVQKDYRNYLDACWTRELRDYGKVEINQEVLKTVNND